MKRREKELKEQVERLEGDIRETQKIYEENSRKVLEPQEAARNTSDQENLRRRLFEEKAQRVADLRARQNNYVGERNLIEKMQEELREGQMPDRDQVAKMQERINANAQAHLEDIRGVQNYTIDNLRKKVDGDQRRLDDLKNGKDEGYRGRDIRTLPQGAMEPQNQMSFGLPRPMSKKALVGQNILNQPYNQIGDGYNPSMEALAHRQNENERLRAEVDNIRQQMDGEDFAPEYVPVPQYQDNFQQPMRPMGQQPVIRNMPMRRGPQPGQVPPGNQRMIPPQQFAQPPRKHEKDFDDFLQDNFVQNQMKNVDLNEDERMLAHLQMMEADSLRILNRIPNNSELYRFKLEQYKELSTQRAEVEKIVQETRLKKMKRALEMRSKEQDRLYDNQKFMDEVRKQTVATKLAKENKITPPRVDMVSPQEGLNDLNPQAMMVRNPIQTAGQTYGGQEGGYNLNQGFVVHWDYVFGIPKDQEFCQLVYAVTNGNDTLLDPQLVEARPVQDQNTMKNQCVIYENNNIREIEPDKNTNLIIEVQMPAALNNAEEEYTSLGWTFINLFEGGQLNRGKFKLPLYQPPIYKNVNKDAVNQLRPVMDCMILFRISYPWKDEFSNLKNLEPHLNHQDFVVPQIHMKQAATPGVMAKNLFGERAAPKKPKKNQNATMTVNDNTGDSSDEEINGDDTIRPLPQPVGRRQDSREGAPSTTTKPETPHELIARSKGVNVIIHTLHNFKSNNKVKISCCFMSSQFLIRDDFDQDTRRFTSVHNPRGRDIEDGAGASDKRKGNNSLSFEETISYMLNVPKRVRQDRKDIFLYIRVLEIDDQHVGAGTNQSMSQNGGGGKYHLRGWYCHKINEPNGKVIVGSFEENLYSPPEKTPPVDPKDFITTTVSVEYSIEEITGTTVRRKLDG